MRDSGGQIAPSSLVKGTHSDYCVAADADGLVVTVCHSINSMMWGSTGLNVGGISIPDSASGQQMDLARLSPGDYLPNPMNPMIACRDGQWVLATSSIGAGLMQTTLQCVHAVLALGLDVSEAGGRTLLHGVDYGSGDSVVSGDEQKPSAQASTPEQRFQALISEVMSEVSDPRDIEWRLKQKVDLCIEDSIAPDVLAGARALGARLKTVSRTTAAIPRGFWVGVSRDPASGQLSATKSAGAAGLVLPA